MLEKKVIVLKEITVGFSAFNSPVSAICRLERDGDVTSVFLTPVNFRTLLSGEYYFLLMVENERLFCFKLGNRSANFFHSFDENDLGVEFSAGIFSVDSDIPVLVAYQKSENFSLSLKQFKVKANEKFMEIRKERLKKEKENEYNDYLLAEENYFLKEKDDGCLPLKDEVACTCRTEIEKEELPCDNASENEKDTHPFHAFGEDFPYFDTVKDELEKVLSKFESESQLNSLFPASQFVKINYSSDKFYVVGVIKKDDKPKYVCYGVPSSYSKNPPRELDGYCTFIPLSVFNIHGKGYFMMFQDAVTGECVSFS